MTNKFSPKKTPAMSGKTAKVPPSNIIKTLGDMAEEGSKFKEHRISATPQEINEVVERIQKITKKSLWDIFKDIGYPDKRQVDRFVEKGKYPFTSLLALKYLLWGTLMKEDIRGRVTITNEQVREIISVLASHNNKLVNVMTQFFSEKRRS